MKVERSAGVFPLRGEFVGREDTLTQLADSFVRGARCVTVTGPAGVGKTRLAEEFARGFSVRFEAGGLWADMAEVVDRRGLLHALAESFAELSVGAVSRGQLVACLAARASGKRLLLVIDNFDRLLDAAGEIAAICRAVPSLCVLLTSREPLQIEGESVHELLPLSVPALAASPAEIAASPSVRLLLSRVRAAGGAWAIDTEQLAMLVRRLDGLPLAIELVAAWSLTLTPALLLARLASSPALLVSTKGTRGRHSSLQEALRSSWELLSEQEQVALAECSVFSGSFSLQACEQVLSCGGEALQTINALRIKSLLRPIEGGRYQPYAAVRAFAGEKLLELDRERVSLLRIRHADWFAERAAAFNLAHALDAAPNVATYEPSLELDADNLLTARAFLDNEVGQTSVIKQAELAVACSAVHAAPQKQALAFLDHSLLRLESSLRAEGVGSLLLRLHLARMVVLARLGRYHESRIANESLVDRLVGAERAAVLVRLGVAHRYEGDLASAERAHRAAERLLGSEVTRLGLLNRACLGRLLCDRGEVEAARELHEAVRVDGLCLGDPWIVGMVVSNLAQLEQEQERALGNQQSSTSSSSRITQLYEQALAVLPHAQIDNVVSTRMMLGDAALELGQLAFAELAYHQAQQLAPRASGLSRGLLLGSLAVLCAERGDVAQARARLDEALALVGRGPFTATFILRLYRAVVELHELGAQGSTDARSAAVARLRSLLEVDDDRSHATMDLRTARRIAGRALALTEVSSDQVTLSVPRRELCRGSQRVSLSRRPTLFRVLLALAEHHCKWPGVPLDRFELIARAWPNERILPDAAATRLRVAVAHLRKLGLRELLRTHEEGYLLEPATVLRISPTLADEAA